MSEQTFSGWEVRPCGLNLDICEPIEPGAKGVAVVATVFAGQSAANVMAAAPEIYGALCRIIENTDYGVIQPRYVDAARTALAKARGEA